MADDIGLLVGETYTRTYIGNSQKYIQTNNIYTFTITESSHGLVVTIISDTVDIEGNESDNPVIINYSNLKSIEKNWKE